MRIAMVGLRGLPATFGGIEKHVEELGWRLAERGHEVSVFCRPNYAGDLDLPTEFDYVAPVGRRPGRYRGMILRNLPTVEGKGVEAFVHSGLAAASTVGRGFDVVHFHALGPGLFAPIPKFLTGAGVVQTIHGLDDERSKWGGLGSRLLQAGRWVSTRVPDEVVVVSRELGRVYSERHHRATVYIPNGAPTVTPVAPGATLARLGLEPGRYVLFVGRLVPEKRPDLLIRAFREVPGDARLVIVGDTANTRGYTGELKKLAAADARVVMTGYLFGADLAQVMTSAGVFVQPSTLEGLPITLLEAAAYERPVVVSDIPPHLEVVGASARGHRVFPDGSQNDLTEAITAELADPAGGADGGRELAKAVRAHYDWDAATDQLIEVYRRAGRR